MKKHVVGGIVSYKHIFLVLLLNYRCIKSKCPLITGSIAQYKSGLSTYYFSYFSTKTHVVGTH